MSNDNAIKLLKTTTVLYNPITGILRQEASKLLAQVLETEIDVFII
jgi:hypothetical protein